MRERLAVHAGTVSAGPAGPPGARGWSVLAALPDPAALPDTAAVPDPAALPDPAAIPVESTHAEATP
jgi:hypothetical protein